MTRSFGGVILLLCVLPGCFSGGATDRKTTPEAIQSLPGAAFATPPAVQPDQVNERNVRQVCQMVEEELNREETLPR